MIRSYLTKKYFVRGALAPTSPPQLHQCFPSCYCGLDWFDSKICLPKLGQAKILARIFLPKSWPVLCEVGYFFGFYNQLSVKILAR